MKLIIKSLLVAIMLSASAGAAYSAGHLEAAITARQSDMRLRAFNLGILGAMAKGKMDYNADAAKAASHNLKVLSTLNASAMWPKGSDNFEMGKKTTAAAALWENFPKVIEAAKGFGAAAAAMDEAAGKDLASLQGAIGAVGKSCGVCHKQFRVKTN